MKVLGVRLPESLIAEIDRRAQVLPASVTGRRSAIVREALEQAFSTTPKKEL